jgi:cellulose synthase operon protein C
VLRRRWLAALLLAALAARASAQDDEADDGLRRPRRLTVGSADQLLGQLAPDGRTLYYVSNRNTTTEIDVQDLADGRSHLLFDEGTDVNWPRVSPDRHGLLYVSFRERATGQLCVRDLPGAGNRRCLDDDASALQAEWIDAHRIALLSRPAIHGDLALLQVDVGRRRLSARPLLQRNLTSPAISPDGRWVVYVPLERRTARVGPAFAGRAAAQLEAVRLDRAGAPIRLPLDLPGQSSQPAFSRDGQQLYVSQFFSDSNHDGSIDNDDHGVLFRVPFPSARDDAPAVAAAAFPEQLTDDSWNCQYPSPAADRLIATCARGGGLDIYELPLDGEVPSTWTPERLSEEIALGGARADELLLYRHRLGRAANLAGRRWNMVRLVRLHLDADEFTPADFYARHVAALQDPEAAGLSAPLVALIEQRRARRERERGRIGADYADQARRRLDELSAHAPPSPAAAVLAQVVKSEIHDDLGDKGAARRELEAAVLPERTPRSILELYHERADALYRQLDDAAALAQVCRRLATLPSLAPPDQLGYARATVRALVRGLPFDQAAARLAQERSGLPADAELSFALDLGRLLLAVRDERPPAEVEAALLDLYARQTRPDRRRALIDEAIRRAGEVGADRLVEGLADRYLSDVKPGSGERRQAQRIYRRVMTTRAYRRMAEGHLDEARIDFQSVAERTDSLESLIGALDLRIRAGEKPEVVAQEFRAGGNAKPAQAALARAYLAFRAIARMPDAQRAAASASAVADLRGNWGLLRDNRAAQDIYGALLHEQFLRNGDPAVAERATAHYLVALDLMQGNVRFRATVLGQLALLQMAVGNHRIALTYLQQRQRLPFPDNTAALSIRLATARVLLHVGQEKEAAATAEAALAMIPGAPRLQKFRPLALDRAALCNLAAGQFARALELYDLYVPLADADTSPPGVRNRFVTRLARAAAALGANQPRRALDDLAVVDRQLQEPPVTATLRWPHAAPEEVLDTYRLIAAGLRANANRSVGDLAGVTHALEQRRATFASRLKRSDRDEDLRALVLAELRLARTAADRGEPSEAGAWVGQAADHAGQLVKRTHANADAAELDALWMGAQLQIGAASRLPFDLTKRLQDASRRLVEKHEPAWRTYQAWLEIYLALLTAPGG